MKLKRIVLFIVILAVILGLCFFVPRYMENKKFEATLLKLSDYLDTCKVNMHFTEEEYEILSKKSYMPWPQLKYAMRTKPFRVTILNKLSSLVQQKDFAQLLDLIWCLSQNEFMFATEGNDFDILFSDSDLREISDYIIENSSGSQKEGYATAYRYKGKLMIFHVSNNLFTIMQGSDVLDSISVETKGTWKTSKLRARYGIHVGQEFCEENLVDAGSSGSQNNGDYGLSDYLKDNAPDLYDDIKDRYENLR